MSRYFLVKVQYISRAGSRVANPAGEAPTYDFGKIFQKKIHEIEKMLGRGGGAPGAPPRFATDFTSLKEASVKLIEI